MIDRVVTDAGRTPKRLVTYADQKGRRSIKLDGRRPLNAKDL
jgi:hypothetical protein